MTTTRTWERRDKRGRGQLRCQNPCQSGRDEERCHDWEATPGGPQIARIPLRNVEEMNTSNHHFSKTPQRSGEKREENADKPVGNEHELGEKWSEEKRMGYGCKGVLQQTDNSRFPLFELNHLHLHILAQLRTPQDRSLDIIIHNTILMDADTQSSARLVL